MCARAPLFACVLAAAAAPAAASDSCNSGVVLNKDSSPLLHAGFGECCNQNTNDCYTTPCAPVIGKPLVCLAVPYGRGGIGGDWYPKGPCVDSWDTGYCGHCPNCTHYASGSDERKNCESNNAINHCQAGDVQTCNCPWEECHAGECHTTGSVEAGTLDVRCTSSTCKLTPLAIGLAAAAGVLFLCCFIGFLYACCCRGCCSRPAAAPVYVAVPTA